MKFKLGNQRGRLSKQAVPTSQPNKLPTDGVPFFKLNPTRPKTLLTQQGFVDEQNLGYKQSQQIVGLGPPMCSQL